MSVLTPTIRLRKPEPPPAVADRSSQRPQPVPQSVDWPLFDARFRRLVDHLHRLGPRPLAELLTELVGTDEQARRDVFHLLEKYGGLDPALVRVLGGSGFPAPPLHEVRG